MGKLTDWVKKNARDGADISEVEGLIETLSIDKITSKEQALDFILKNDALKKGLDSYVTKSITNHDEKFREEKLPGLIEEAEEKIKAKLNPPQSETDKELAEVKKKFAAMELKEAKGEIEKALREKAKELKYPIEKAERFSVYGENALTQLEQEAEYITSIVNSRIETEVKERFGDNPQPQKKEPINPKSLDEQIYQARMDGNSELAGKLQIQKNQPQQ